MVIIKKSLLSVSLYTPNLATANQISTSIWYLRVFELMLFYAFGNCAGGLLFESTPDLIVFSPIAPHVLHTYTVVAVELEKVNDGAWTNHICIG